MRIKQNKYIKVDKPILVLGYDWERYQKHPNNEKSKKESLKGLKAIINAHREYNKPLTIYVVGRMLELKETLTLFQDITRKYSNDFLDIQQHTYAHTLIKDHAFKGKGLSLDELKVDITKATNLIQKWSDKKVIGMHSAQSFYKGMQGEVKRLQILWECGIRFISSDGRGMGEKAPAPWKDENGNFRQPYFYRNEGYPELLEIPNQGYSDNYYKGLSKYSDIEPMTPEEELDAQTRNMEVALKHNLVFVPVQHPWSIAKKDPNTTVIKGMLSFAIEKGIEVMSAKQLYDYFLSLCF